jgi:hypothetical protein
VRRFVEVNYIVVCIVREEKPVLLRKPTDQEITEGDDARFEVDVIGKPDPTVNW